MNNIELNTLELLPLKSEISQVHLFIFLLMSSFLLLFCMNGFLFWAVSECMMIWMIGRYFLKSKSFSSCVIIILFEFFFSCLFFLGIFSSSELIFSLFLFGKFGLFPFWMWVFRLFDDIEKETVFLFMSLYKLFVLIFFMSSSIVEMTSMIVLVNILVIFPMIFLLFNFNKLVACLSIYSLTWLFSMGSEIIPIFFLFYCFALFLLLYTSSSNLLTVSLLFYVGFPPFPIFFLKILMIINTFSFSFFIGMLVFTSSTLLFFICWMISSTKKWENFWTLFSFLSFSVVVWLFLFSSGVCKHT